MLQAERAHVVQHWAQIGRQAAHQTARCAQIKHLLQAHEVQTRRHCGYQHPARRPGRWRATACSPIVRGPQAGEQHGAHGIGPPLAVL